MKNMILTLIGPDATGIVARIAQMVETHGGNWLDSRLMRLGGTFSGIVSLELPERSLSRFGEEVSAFMQEGRFQFTLQSAGTDEVPAEGAEARMSLSGQDHPGIVHAIFKAFQGRGVNVEELATGISIAPWSGTPVFEAQARLRIPESVSLDQLKSDLEALAADLMVEIDFRES